MTGEAYQLYANWPGPGPAPAPTYLGQGSFEFSCSCLAPNRGGVDGHDDAEVYWSASAPGCSYAGDEISIRSDVGWGDGVDIGNIGGSSSSPVFVTFDLDGSSGYGDAIVSGLAGPGIEIVATVPEPGTITLCYAALLTLVGVRCARSRRRTG
jgi:hypothetical protein